MLGRLWRNWNPHTFWWEWKMVFGHCGIRQFFKKLVTIRPSNSTPRYIPKRAKNMCSHKNLYLNIHANIIHNRKSVKKRKEKKKCKQLKCPSIGEWINKMSIIQFFVMKYWHVLQHGYLIILLSRSQTQNAIYYMSPLMECPN